MKKLVLTEKPSVARDFAKVLDAKPVGRDYFEGKDYVIIWAYGHLLSLKLPEDLDPKWKSWEMETLPMIPKKIGLKPLPKTQRQLKLIERLARRKDISGAVIATDSGREGEAVGRFIFEWIRFSKPLERLWISSQTKKAIMEGFNHLKPARDYEALYQSAVARAKADWLIGLNVTRALTVKYQDSLSAGRVQTPTLALVARAQKQVETFIPKEFFTIQLTHQGASAAMNPPKQFKDHAAAERFAANLADTAQVAEITEKERRVAAPLPYDLTELQQAANQRYQFSAKKTLSLAQSLYETHKVLSYPRTDSKYLPQDIEATLSERLQAVTRFDPAAKKILHDGAKLQQKKVINDQRVTDHFALIPTEEAARPEKMSSDEVKIYRMVVERFLGLFEAPEVTRQQKITVKCGAAAFVFHQNEVLEAGWKHGETTDKQLVWKKGERFPADFRIKKGWSKAPTLLNEGTLLAQMEKNGLGTPATRAEIIEKLIKSDVMERTNNLLKATPKGKQLLELVNPSLVSPELTAKWEKNLDAIAAGREQADAFVHQIEKDTKRLVAEVKAAQTEYKDFSLTTKICPECGAKLRERNGRDGKRYVCSNSECNYQRRKDPKVSNHRCPQCHKKMIIIEGQNGAFFKCQTCGITEKLDGKGKNKKKMNKHEERKLLKKYSQEEETMESPLAAALKAAMNKD